MNAIGPILSHELRTLARRRQTFRWRISFSMAILLALGLLYLLTYAANPTRLSPRSTAGFADSIFLNVVCLQMSFTIWVVPACVAVVIAEEKEKRTLSYLALTRLMSAEIVVGKLAAGLVHYATWLVTGLPILVLLVSFGGVDPRWVLLATAGTATTAYFVAGLSIVVSTAAARAGKAVGEAIGLALLWVVVPLLAHLFVPARFPVLWRWAQPVNDWVLASSPSSLLLAAWGRGIGPGWRLIDSFVWMIGLQVAVGSLFVAWGIGRFRAACRLYENTYGSLDSGELPQTRLWAAIRRLAPVRRIPCGEKPMLWKELCTARRRTLAEHVSVFVALGFVALVGYAIFPFAMRAFHELFQYGFDPSRPEIRRMEFNEILRIVTSLIEFFVLLAIAGIAATGMTEERASQTWDSLLATPLAARQIIEAKMIGAAWKIRWAALLLLALWFIGVLAGSIHPLGFGAALLLLAVSTWFATALGTYTSLVSRDTRQASNRALVPVLLLSASFLACYIVPRTTSVIVGAASAPFVNWLSLVSYADVREIFTGQRLQPFSIVRGAGLYSGEGPAGVLVAFVLATGASIAAAAWLSQAAVARFDRVAGRPHRSAGDCEADASLIACPVSPWALSS